MQLDEHVYFYLCTHAYSFVGVDVRVVQIPNNIFMLDAVWRRIYIFYVAYILLCSFVWSFTAHAWMETSLLAISCMPLDTHIKTYNIALCIPIYQYNRVYDAELSRTTDERELSTYCKDCDERACYAMQSCTKVDGSKGSETSTTLTGFNKGPVQNCDGTLSSMQASLQT